MSRFFKTPLTAEVKFDDEDKRQFISSQVRNVSDARSSELAPLYDRDESVRGFVTLRPRDGRKVEHVGVKVQFVGQIELINDKGQHDEFISLAKEIVGPGEIRHAETYNFEFRNVEKPYESYNGVRARLRYFVRVIVYGKNRDVVQERDIWVHQFEPESEPSSLINMDVGIEDCLHIEFEYTKSKYDLNDVIVGRIYFLLVRLKLKHMELLLQRKEIIGTQSEIETVVRFEIMDGAPVRGEQIPIRLYLEGFNLVPTMRDVNKRFSVRNYLSLVLIDEAGRRYFKQSEIQLYRKLPEASEA